MMLSRPSAFGLGLDRRCRRRLLCMLKLAQQVSESIRHFERKQLVVILLELAGDLGVCPKEIGRRCGFARRPLATRLVDRLRHELNCPGFLYCRTLSPLFAGSMRIRCQKELFALRLSP